MFTIRVATRVAKNTACFVDGDEVIVDEQDCFGGNFD